MPLSIYPNPAQTIVGFNVNQRGEQLVDGSGIESIKTLLVQLVAESKRQTMILSTISGVYVEDDAIGADTIYQ
jgi:hypothetical protein